MLNNGYNEVDIYVRRKTPDMKKQKPQKRLHPLLSTTGEDNFVGEYSSPWNEAEVISETNNTKIHKVDDLANVLRKVSKV